MNNLTAFSNTWIAMLTLVGLLAIAGCQPGTKQDTVDVLISAKAELTAAANTLADAADAGLISRKNPKYQNAKELLIEAQTTLKQAWALYFEDDIYGADLALVQTRSLYLRVRPILNAIATQEVPE